MLLLWLFFPPSSYKCDGSLNLVMMMKDVPAACVVVDEVPGGREVLTGEVSTHPWKRQLHVFLWDFTSVWGREREQR